MDNNKAIFCRFRRPEAAVRLLCLPWAGGGSLFYAGLGQDFPDNIEVCGVRPPGRESRFKEPMPLHMATLIKDLTESLLVVLKEKPFILFGHSFGALCAYELAVHIKKEHGLEPLHLFISAMSPPHEIFKNQNPAPMTDETILQLLRRQQGTPEQILNTPELLKMVIATVKGDFTLLNNYRNIKPPGVSFLECPVTYLDGEGDLRANQDYWGELTTGSFNKVIFPGGHFYFFEENNRETFLRTIIQNFCNL